MVRIAASKLRETLAEVLNRVTYKRERIVLKRHGKDVAALVSLEDLALLEELEERLDVEEVKRRLADEGDKSNP